MAKSVTFVLVALIAILCFTRTTHAFNISSVPIATRENWCTNQMSTCTALCQDNGNTAQTNTCTAQDLTYACVCSNGFAPNQTQYTQTIPFFECTADQEACRTACPPADQACADKCNAVPCAATAPKKYNATSTALSPTASSTGFINPTAASNPSILSGGSPVAAYQAVNAGLVVLITVAVFMFQNM